MNKQLLRTTFCDVGDIAEETLMWQAAFSEWVQLKMCGELLSRLKEEAPVHMIMPDDEELKVAGHSTMQHQGSAGGGA